MGFDSLDGTVSETEVPVRIRPDSLVGRVGTEVPRTTSRAVIDWKQTPYGQWVYVDPNPERLGQIIRGYFSPPPEQPNPPHHSPEAYDEAVRRLNRMFPPQD